LGSLRRAILLQICCRCSKAKYSMPVLLVDSERLSNRRSGR
jgi:hypothetical protein